MTPQSAQVPASRYWCFGLLLAGALAWDLFSKSWVFAELGFPFRQAQWSWQTPLLWGKFSITLYTSFNNGALWGLGQGQGWLFALLSVAASALVLYVLFVRGMARSWWLTISLALIAAGALGNLYDRLYLHGCTAPDGTPLTGVRDFIKCDLPGIEFVRGSGFRLLEQWEWPIFNFADSFLVTGAILLILQALFAKDRAACSATDSASPATANAAPPASLAASAAPRS